MMKDYQKLQSYDKTKNIAKQTPSRVYPSETLHCFYDVLTYSMSVSANQNAVAVKIHRSRYANVIVNM